MILLMRLSYLDVAVLGSLDRMTCMIYVARLIGYDTQNLMTALVSTTVQVYMFHTRIINRMVVLQTGGDPRFPPRLPIAQDQIELTETLCLMSILIFFRSTGWFSRMLQECGRMDNQQALVCTGCRISLWISRVFYHLMDSLCCILDVRT